jgi:hypothetical protein
MKIKLLNAALFQLVWLCAVLGAANGRPWLGPLVLLPVVALHLLLSNHRRRELRLLALAGVIGALFDTGAVLAGVITPQAWLYPPPFSPPWMIALWINLAATLNVSLSWLQGRPWYGALFGAIGGPLAYYSGARLGATATLPEPGGLLLLALGWGIVTPILLAIANPRGGTHAP